MENALGRLGVVGALLGSVHDDVVEEWGEGRVPRRLLPVGLRSHTFFVLLLFF